MLKVLKESQKPTLTVTGGIPMPGITIATTDQIILIYDVNKSESTFFNYSKVTYVINELFGIQSASANPLVLAVPTGIELWLGSSIIVGGVLYKMDNEYQASTNYSRVYTPNAPEGSYLPALTSNPMLSGLNTGLFANTIDQMRFDGIIPEVDTSTARNNSVGNHGRTMPIAHTATSALLQEIRMDIDPNASKPTILSTPIAYQPKSILFTPDDRSTFVQWSQLPGFMPGDFNTKDLLEGFDVHETNWKDLILYKLYLDSVEKVNNRYPINADFAGQKFPLDKLPEHIQQKYPGSVMFDEQGFARFEPYTLIDELGRVHDVELENITGGKRDHVNANKAMGIKDLPKGYMWHHVEHSKRMIAIPRDLHKAVPHTGGSATNKELGNKW